MISPSVRSVLFAGLCAAAIMVSSAYIVLGRRSAATGTVASAADPVLLAEAVSQPHLLVRRTALDATYGQVNVLRLDRLEGPPVPTALFCERIYFAGGLGVCLAADRGMRTSYRAELFDSRFQVRHTVPIGGVPSRARVAPDGSSVAFTYFVSGDSYAAGGFSTRSLLVDSGTAAVLGDLEQFRVTRDGAPFTAVDFNFWGVTFARQPATLFATLATGGKMYLVEADARARTARVVREGIECPSLSPDNRRIAFKKRMPGIRLLWRIHVLDLASGQETMLAETRSVDDQVEWLDDQSVLYALPGDMRKARSSMNIWAVPADGTGIPRLLIENADSPAVVR